MDDKMIARWHIPGHADGAAPVREMVLHITVEDRQGNEIASVDVAYITGHLGVLVHSNYGVTLNAKTQDVLSGSARLTPQWVPEIPQDHCISPGAQGPWESEKPTVSIEDPDLTTWVAPRPRTRRPIMTQEECTEIFGVETPKSTTLDRPDCLTVMSPRPIYPSSKHRDLMVYHLVVRGPKGAHTEGAAALSLEHEAAVEELALDVRHLLAAHGLIDPEWTMELMGITEALDPEEATHDPA